MEAHAILAASTAATLASIWIVYEETKMTGHAWIKDGAQLGSSIEHPRPRVNHQYSTIEYFLLSICHRRLYAAVVTFVASRPPRGRTDDEVGLDARSPGPACRSEASPRLLGRWASTSCVDWTTSGVTEHVIKTVMAQQALLTLYSIQQTQQYQQRQYLTIAAVDSRRWP
jgi:hypothetical protein